jgi:arginyl-tRNA synthetase
MEIFAFASSKIEIYGTIRYFTSIGVFLKKIIVDLIYNSLENIEKQLIERTTNESKLNEYDYASSIFISNKTLDFESFKEKLLQDKLIKKVDFVNGYVNILLDRIYLLNNFSLNLEKENKKIMLEFPSPNSNKPLHLGHVRNMLLGQSLSNLLEKKYSVIRTDLINDRGIHICKSMLGYLKYSKFKSPEEANRKSDFFVGDCYVLYSNAEKENPEIIKEAELLLQKWESGDKETLELWQKMKTWAIKGMDETFKEL